MKKSYYLPVFLLILLSFGCNKGEKPDKNNTEAVSEIYKIKLKKYIEHAAKEPNPDRIERFASVLSPGNPEYIASNLQETIISISGTDDKAIVYYLKQNNKNHILGSGYYGYVLFLDGWFRYCYILEADDGSWVLVDNTSAGFPPKWSGIEMDDLAFSFDVNFNQFS